MISFSKRGLVLKPLSLNSALHPPALRRLSPQDIKARGWLLNQLKIQAAGLSGNLDKFWPDIKDSQWIGGDAEGWERVPYWLDGFIPLAWLLDDEDMKARAKRYIETIIANQADDGWICPDKQTPRYQYDLWAFFLILKVLVVYYEFTKDERIEDVVRRGLRSIERHIDGRTLFNWAHTRWFEALISIWWLYDRTHEAWLLDLATKLRSQGFDWIEFYRRWPYTKPDPKGRWSQMSHVVNNAMMLKAGALLWRLTGEKEHLDSADHKIALLDRYHGMVTGVFSGDECLAGQSPVRGTELCAVAEYMYSLEHLIEITGRPHFADRLEKITFNALPATYSPDMWTHQYDQQVNQIECSKQEEPVFGTNGPESNLFGLEPNFGCCTANLSQPWPKFALSTWMRSHDGLVATVLAPSEVDTVVHGASVRVTLDTEYPFREHLTFTVTTDKEVDMTLWIRIPAWAENATVTVDNAQSPGTPGAYFPVRRTWSGTTTVSVHLPMEAKLVSRPNDLFAVERGPLVYALPIEEKWVQVNQDIPGREFPHCDYEIHPVGPWNYGLRLDPESLSTQLKVEEQEIGDYPFSPEGAPIALRVKGKKVDWEREGGSAAPVPRLDWVADEAEELKLIPYGCTNLRVTEMPLVK